MLLTIKNKCKDSPNLLNHPFVCPKLSSKAERDTYGTSVTIVNFRQVSSLYTLVAFKKINQLFF